MQLNPIGIKMSFLILAAKICFKGMAFVPFWPEDGYRFCLPDYGLESGMVFKGTTIAYELGIFACNMFSFKYYYMIIENAETIY